MRVLTQTILLFLSAVTLPYRAEPAELPLLPLKLQSTSAPPGTHPADRETDAVDLYINASMTRQHIPGLTLAVILDGKVKKAKAYGLASVELNVPATPETVYELASATKPFVATAVMLLVQDGIIRLEDPVGKFVEGVPDAWKRITVRQLLTHTSGIKDYLSDLRRDFPNDTPPETIVRAAMEAPLNFTPGEKWSYSNTGYVLLGMIVRRASGKSYDTFLEDRVFKPLGMVDTLHDTPDEVIPNRAVGYLWYGPGGLRNGEFLKYQMTNHGDRGILTTALDLIKWDVECSAGRILGPSGEEAMRSRVKLNDGSTAGYGLGWFLEDVNRHRHVYHPGGAPGTATIISRYPEDRLTVILLANGGAAYVQGLAFGVAQRYIPGLVSRTVVTLKTELLNSYTGYYNVYGSQLLKVSRGGDQLVLDDGGRLVNAFLPVSEIRFVAEDADRGFTLTRTDKGEVSGMTLRLIADEMPAQRIGPLFRSLKPQADPDRALTGRVGAILKAFAEGGKAVEAVGSVAPQAREDYSRGPSPELRGIKEISFIAAKDVSERGIVRHGGKVARVLYCRLMTDREPRQVLVYLTAEGLVTDQDTVVEQAALVR
jgi:CubicO group peptidase (beta-lactamase class C family)